MLTGNRAGEKERDNRRRDNRREERRGGNNIRGKASRAWGQKEENRLAPPQGVSSLSPSQWGRSSVKLKFEGIVALYV